MEVIEPEEELKALQCHAFAVALGHEATELLQHANRHFEPAAASRLTRTDGDFDRGVRPENLAVNSMMLRVPVPDAALDLAEKVEAMLLRQVPEITDQVCDGMRITGVAVSLKYSDGLGGPRDVVGFIGHASH
jgi:hypothetical protein